MENTLFTPQKQKVKPEIKPKKKKQYTLHVNSKTTVFLYYRGKRDLEEQIKNAIEKYQDNSKYKVD